MTQLLRISMIGLVLSACGGSDGPNFGPPMAPTAMQQTAIASTTQYVNLIAGANDNGQAAAGAAISFALVAPGLLGGAAGTSDLPAVTNAEAAISALAAVTRRIEPSGCEVVTDHSVTWNHCMDNEVTIDGTVSWSPGHVDVDVHATASTQNVSLDYSFTGSLTVSSTAVKGDMTVAFHASSGGQSASATVRTQIDVQLAAGCITGGTLTVTETGTGTGARNAAIQVVWTGCNMFQVRNG